KQMALIKALNICGAFVPNERLDIAAFNSWLASGVLRPLIQSKAVGILSDSGMVAACSLNFFIKVASISSFRSSFCSALIIFDDNTKLSIGQYNTSLNHANTSPKADWPASSPIKLGI